MLRTKNKKNGGVIFLIPCCSKDVFQWSCHKLFELDIVGEFTVSRPDLSEWQTVKCSTNYSFSTKRNLECKKTLFVVKNFTKLNTCQNSV